jgi:hypothetical protein
MVLLMPTPLLSRVGRRYHHMEAMQMANILARLNGVRTMTNDQ